MNMFNRKDTIKNSVVEEFDVPENLDLLNKWTIPRIKPSLIYKLGTFEKIGLKQIVKTTESSVSLHNEEIVIKLLHKNDILPYKKTHSFLHIGCVQIAFRPLTLEGLPESFLAALRDARNRNWKQSLIGIIESSLALGPVYFDAYPNLNLSLTDPNICDSLTLNVKTHGYNYIEGTEVMCICYRIYFKPLHTMNPMVKRMDKENNETVLIETNFGKSHITTRRSIKWSEIVFPENWVIEQSSPKIPLINTDLQNITQTEDGLIDIRRTMFSRSMSGHIFLSPLDYEVNLPSSSRPSTSHYRCEGISYSKNDFQNNNDIIINKNNVVLKENNPETISECNFDL